MTQGDVARFNELVAREACRQLDEGFLPATSQFLLWRGMPANDIWHERREEFDNRDVSEASRVALAGWVLYGV